MFTIILQYKIQKYFNLCTKINIIHITFSGDLLLKNLIRKQIKKTDIVKGLEEEKKELTNKVNQLQIENNNFKSQVNNFLESRETINLEIADLI